MSSEPKPVYAPLVISGVGFLDTGRRVNPDVDEPVAAVDVAAAEQLEQEENLIEPIIVDVDTVNNTVFLQCPNDLQGAVVPLGSKVHVCAIDGVSLRVPNA